MQLGNPPERWLPTHSPRTNLDKEELLHSNKVALHRGAMLTVTYQYLWDIALVIDGCNVNNMDKINWDDHRLRCQTKPILIPYMSARQVLQAEQWTIHQLRLHSVS